MSRDYQIEGEVLVRVSNAIIGADGAELGLSSDQIKIIPRWQHKDLNTDDFGPNIPPEKIWLLADCMINMTLIHSDQRILRACIDESMGGSKDGTLAAAGIPMGGGVAIGAANNHWITLVLDCDLPWRFFAASLAENPIEWPIGTHASLIQCNWVAIPYAFPKIVGHTPGEAPTISMSKYPLFDHKSDFNIPAV